MSADTAALLACPFCGSTDAVRLDDGDSWDFLPDGEPLTWAVVCDYNRGGCGGSGGFRDSQKDAIAAWNQAADRLAELEAESSRLQAGIQLYKADFEHGLNGLKHEYAKLEQDNARLRGLLGAARCPNCDGSGVIPHGPLPDGSWEAEECQWCYEKQEALAAGGDA